MRTSAEAGVDVIKLATNEAHAGERGYFTLLEEDSSSPESQNQEKQQSLWVKSLGWAKIAAKEHAFEMAVE